MSLCVLFIRRFLKLWTEIFVFFSSKLRKNTGSNRSASRTIVIDVTIVLYILYMSWRGRLVWSSSFLRLYYFSDIYVICLTHISFILCCCCCFGFYDFLYECIKLLKIITIFIFQILIIFVLVNAFFWEKNLNTYFWYRIKKILIDFK